MLEQLSVKNYALIEEVDVEFGSGLNVLTGETGAGKSILVGALSLLLGEKPDSSAIRAGAEQSLVSATIRVEENSEALSWMEAHGISGEEGCVVLRAVVRKSGRSSIFIQSAQATRQELKQFASLIFDLHGQHEHQSLLQVVNHRKLLDRYGGTEGLAQATAALHRKLTEFQGQYQKLEGAERDRLREIDLMKFTLNEIEAAKLKPGEYDELEAERKKLANFEKLTRLLGEIYEAVADSRGGCLGPLSVCRDNLNQIVEYDVSLSKLESQLQNAYYELEDFADSIRAYSSTVEFDPQRLALVEERLFLIRGLMKKYGGSIPDILAYAEKCKQDARAFENREARKKLLEDQIGDTESELNERARELSTRRTNAASELSEQIGAELQQLGMVKARFKVVVQRRLDHSGNPVVGPGGMDNVEFIISTNLGEPFKRLTKIVSGGELSRIMLAIKSILAESDHVGALIFDEVDAGIGGEVALAVGDRLRKLAALKQILCVTHLATIAVRADVHVRVFKKVRGSRAETVVVGIEGEERKIEISRMLSGDKDNTTSLKHAEELIKRYGLPKD